MVALGRGFSPVDAVPLAATPRAVTALPQSLVALGDLPGARYVLVTDADGDRVRGELGGPPDSDLAVLAWARRLADVSAERGRTMEDVVLTTESSFHLVRRVPGVGEDVWVALRIDREHGNLALARRALGALVTGRAGAGRSRALPSGPAARVEPISGSFPAPVSGSSAAPISGSFRAPVSGPFAAPGRGSFPAPVSGSSAAPRVDPGRPRSPRGPDVGPGTGSLPAAMPSAGTPMSLAPAPRRTPDAELPRPASRTGADVPALAFLPPSRPTTRPVRVAPEEVPPPATSAVRPAGVNGTVRIPDVGDEPRTPTADTPAGDLPASGGSSAPSAAEPVDRVVRAPDVSSEPFTPAEPTEGTTPDDGDLHAPDGSSAPSSDADSDPAPTPDGTPDEPGMWDPRRRPLTVRQARTWRTAPEVPEVPPARESAEHSTPAPHIPAPRAASLFAPVVVVPPPPSPVDDDTTEVPAPVPYPIITAPPLEPAPAPVVTAPEPAPEEEQVATDAGLPRRVPGAHLRSPTPAPDPAPAAAPAVGIPGWSTEQSVLRRLLTGLRRLS